jgi:hypothetical protein
MNTVIKLTSEEIQSIQDLQTKYASIASRLGQIKIEQILAKSQLNNLEKLELEEEENYKAIQTSEISLAETLKEKYGEGQVNLETGEYISFIRTV